MWGAVGLGLAQSGEEAEVGAEEKVMSHGVMEYDHEADADFAFVEPTQERTTQTKDKSKDADFLAVQGVYIQKLRKWVMEERKKRTDHCSIWATNKPMFGNTNKQVFHKYMCCLRTFPTSSSQVEMILGHRPQAIHPIKFRNTYT